MSRLRKMRKKQNNTNDCINQIELELLTCRGDIKVIDDNLKEKLNNIQSVDSEINSDLKLYEKIEVDLKNMQWDNRTKEVSIHTKIERILENHGIKIQRFHGGTLTGGAILKLLEKHEIIMDDITHVCHEYISNHKSGKYSVHMPSIDNFDKVLDAHRCLFKAQDAAYAHLRLINPTTKEMAETRERIAIMKILWLQMGLSITPKAHLVFDHAADDQLKYGGIGDKIEDPLEKRHQEQMRLDNILNKMSGGFQKKMTTQLKYEWRNTHPLVMDHIACVHSLTTRKRRIDEILLVERHADELKQERHQMRDNHINRMKVTLM
jgi:hypothetical protein